MNRPAPSKAMTRHTPVVLVRYDRNLGRDREHLMVGENRCGAPSYVGCTTTVEAMVTCAKCVELLKEAR